MVLKDHLRHVFDSKDKFAVLGIHALKQFNIIIDTKSNHVYIRSRDFEAETLTYNRLGASFPPKDLNSPDLIGVTNI